MSKRSLQDNVEIIYQPEDIEKLSIPEILRIPSRVLMKRGQKEKAEEYEKRASEISGIIKRKLEFGPLSALEHDEFIECYSEQKHVVYDFELIRRVVCGDQKATDYFAEKILIVSYDYDKLSDSVKSPYEQLCKDNFKLLDDYSARYGCRLKTYIANLVRNWKLYGQKSNQELPIGEVKYSDPADSSIIESDEYINVKVARVEKDDYLSTMEDIFHAYSLLSKHEMEILRLDVFCRMPQMEILDLMKMFGADWNSVNSVSGKKLDAKEALLKHAKWVQLYRLILGDKYPFKSFYQVCRENPELDKRIEVEQFVWVYDMQCIYNIILIMAEDFNSNRVAFLEEVYKHKIAEESRQFCKYCGKPISPSIRDGRTIYVCNKCGQESEDCILGAAKCIFCGSKRIKEANIGNHKVIVCKKCSKYWRKLPPVTTILNFFFDKENNKEKFPQNFQFYGKDVERAFGIIKEWIVPAFNEDPVEYWTFNQKSAKLNKIRDRAIKGLKNRYCWELLLERIEQNPDAVNQFHAGRIFHLKKAWQDLEITDQQVLKKAFFEGDRPEREDSLERAITNLRAIYLDRLNSDYKN